MGIFSHRQWKDRSFSREELRAEVLRPAMFEMLEPRLLLDGGPTADDDLVALPYMGDSIIVSPLDNDTPDPEGGQTLTIDSFTDGQYGTVTLDGDILTYTKNEGVIFPGRDTFTYTISDGEGGTDTATITIGSTPRLQNDTYTSLYEDTTNNVLDVLSNDADLPIGDALTITDVTGAQHGLATIGVDGEGTPVIYYTPDADFYGTETLTYTVEDTDGLTSTATVFLTVNNLNDDPVANDDTALLNVGATVVTINPLSNDSSSPDPTETFTILSATDGTYGRVTIVGNTLRYTLFAGVVFPGEDTFTYTITDRTTGGLTATGTVTVRDRPVATADDFTVEEDSAGNELDVLANDIPIGEAFTITNVSNPPHGTATAGVDGEGNPVILYTPDGDFVGDDTFTYRAKDADGNYTATTTVTVHVTNTNDDPTAVDDTVALDGGAESISFNPMANDLISPDTGETLSISDFTQPTEGTVTQDGDTLTYTPDDPATFSGYDTFTYTISDGNGGTDTATVVIGSTPTLTDDEFTVAEDSTDNELDVLANDADLPVGGSLTIINGSFNAQHGTVTKNAEGTLLYYTPDADYVGEDTFTYTVEDEDGLQATATVTMTVTAEQDAPVAADDTAVMDYDQASVDIDVLANDDDADGDALNILSFTQGVHGTVVMNTDGETGYQTFTYTPNGEFTGVDTFTYTLQDPVTLLESTATVTVQMRSEAVDDPSENMDEDDPAITIDVLNNDNKHTDNGDLAIDSFTQGHHGTVELNIETQTLTYLPNADFHGTDTFTYTVEDELGFQSTATVTITVDNADDATVKIDFDAIDVNINHNAMSFDLNEYFYDIDPFPNDWAGLFVYRFDTSLGYFDVLLYKEVTPITVANFQQYADAGDYIQSFIHRSVSGFVVQGGGFTYDDAVGNPEDIYTYPSIVNEFGVSNTRGTIAMAKVGDDPDSATSQWFFNLADNSENLDNQNGGFTVFGEVLGNGMDVIDTIAALPTYDWGSPYDNLPLINYDGQSSVTSDNLVMFNSIRPLSLTYSLANTNPGLVDAQIVDGQLVLEYTRNVSGAAQITITATDANGGTVDSVIDIRVNGDPDLVVSFGTVTLPDRPVEGNRGRVQVFVTNQELFTANGFMDIQIWLSLDGDVTNGDGNDYLLTTLANQRVNLRGYRTGSYTANVTLPEIVIPGQYTLVAVVDSGEAIPERNEDNNTAVYDVQTYGMYAQHVDLTGAITKIWYKNYAMTQGERGYAMVQVTNNGNQTANGVMSIDLYISNSAEIAIDGVQVGRLENIRVVLPAGASRTYRVYYTINNQISSDEYWMYTVINPDNTIAENNVANLGYNPKNNNTTDVPSYNPTAYWYDVLVQRPDLRCSISSTGLSSAPMAGELSWAIIRVTNYNAVRAVGLANVQLFLRPKDGGEDIFLANKDGFRLILRGGYSAYLKMLFRLPRTILDEFNNPISLPEGEYQLVAVVTPTSAGLREDNVANNETVSGSYQVRDAFVDLTTRITRRIVKYNPSTQGDLFTAYVAVINKGNAPVYARSVSVKLWASTDNTLHDGLGNEYVLSEKLINLRLAPDREALLNFKYRIPGLDELPAGDYYLIAEIDADDKVLESTDDNSYNAEDNNTHSVYRGLRIGLPDLTGTFRSISLPTMGVVSGATGRAVVKVANDGSVRVLGRYNIKLYASQDGVWDEQDTQIGEALNQLIRLSPNRFSYVNLPINLPLELDGDYRLIAVIDTADAIEESSEINNTVISQATYNVQQAEMDLVGTLGAPIVANPALGGAPIRVPLLIRNNGNVALRQRIDINFFVAGDVNQPIGTLENYYISLAPGQARTVFFNTTLPYVDGDKTYHVEATLDAGNDVFEGLLGDPAETNNHIASALNYQVNEAFVALNGTLQAPLVTDPAAANDNLTATVQIRNAGNVNFIGLVNVEFQTSTGVFLGAKNVTLRLAPNRAANVTHTMALPDTLAAGTYDVVAVVTETPKDDLVTTAVNNTAGVGALVVGAPNLTAAILNTPLTGTGYTNELYSAQVQVANVGDVRSQGRADVELWATSDGVIDGVGDYLLTTLANQPFALQPGQNSTHTLDFILPDGMDNTTYQLATVITPTQGLAAEVGDDNTSVAPPTFDVADGHVDLTVTADWTEAPYGPLHDVFMAGEWYTINVTVTNTGNITARPSIGSGQDVFYTSLYCDTFNNSVQTTDTLLGQVALPSLAPGASVTLPLQFRFPGTLTDDNYNLAVITDSTGVVDETGIPGGEGNNRSPYRVYYLVVP